MISVHAHLKEEWDHEIYPVIISFAHVTLDCAELAIPCLSWSSFWLDEHVVLRQCMGG
jgi:hypothetical protein